MRSKRTGVLELLKLAQIKEKIVMRKNKMPLSVIRQKEDKLFHEPCYLLHFIVVVLHTETIFYGATNVHSWLTLTFILSRH